MEDKAALLMVLNKTLDSLSNAAQSGILSFSDVKPAAVAVSDCIKALCTHHVEVKPDYSDHDDFGECDCCKFADLLSSDVPCDTCAMGAGDNPCNWEPKQ